MIDEGCKSGGGDKLQTSAFDILETKLLAQVMIYENRVDRFIRLLMLKTVDHLGLQIICQDVTTNFFTLKVSQS